MKTINTECFCLDTCFNDADKGAAHCIIPQPDPNCPDCKGSGFISKTTDDIALSHPESCQCRICQDWWIEAEMEDPRLEGGK